MGFIQESRAESALAALRQLAAAHANVIRDGERRSIPAAEIVPGDILLVEEGDTVAADARLLESTALHGGGGLDGRKPAGAQRDGCDGRGSRRRGPTQHDFQRHAGDLRARESGGHGHRDAACA